MLIVYIFLFLLPFTNCQYFTKDEVDIILSISENQFIKHLIIAAENPQHVIRYGIQKLIKEKYFLTILDISYVEDYIQLVPVSYHKSALITKEDVSGIKLAIITEDKISSYTWIIFDNEQEINSETLRKSYIPYNTLYLLIDKVNDTCYDVIEIYNTDYKKIPTAASDIFVSKIQLRNLLGTWTRSEKISVKIPEFYKKRFNLHGSEFTVTGTPYYLDPFYAFAILLLWQDMQRAMNFTYRWLKYSDVLKTDAYVDGLVAITPISSSIYHPSIVGPVFTNNLYMHIRDDFNDDYNWASIFKPFSLKIWLYLIIWLIIPGTLLVIYERRKKEENKDIFGASMAPFDVLCGQWALDDQKSFSWRIVIFFILTSGLFFLNSYTAIFTSFLTVPDPQLPFKDLKGFIKDGTYTIGGPDASVDDYIQTIIADITKTNAEKYMFTSKENIHSAQTAIKRFCSNEKFVLLMVNNIGYIAEQYFNAKCKMYRIPQPITKQYLFFSLRFFSPYKEIFNMFFMSARSNGVLKKHEIRMEKMEGVMSGKMIARLYDSENFDFTATISQMITILYIVTFGWLASLIIFILELVSKAIFTKLSSGKISSP